MRKYVMTKEEKEFLKSYDMSEFNRPSLTADIAVFAILQGEESNEYRKDPEQKLGVLLIKDSLIKIIGLSRVVSHSRVRNSEIPLFVSLEKKLP